MCTYKEKKLIMAEREVQAVCRNYRMRVRL